MHKHQTILFSTILQNQNKQTISFNQESVAAQERETPTFPTVVPLFLPSVFSHLHQSTMVCHWHGMREEEL